MGGIELEQFGNGGGAAIRREFTTRREGAAGDVFGNIGRQAGDRVEFGTFGLEGGNRALEGARVGVARVFEEGASVGGLDDASGVHHLHAVAKTGDDAEIVRDEDNGHAEFALHFADELENLGLDGDVERGGRFVGDEQLGFGDEGHRDHDALAHAAGKFVRIIVDAFRGVVDADGFKHRQRAGEGVAAGNVFVDEEWLDDLLADAQERIERRHRILEDHGDAFAADGTGLARRTMEQVDAIEEGSAADDAAGGLGDEPHDRVTRNGFA